MARHSADFFTDRCQHYVTLMPEPDTNAILDALPCRLKNGHVGPCEPIDLPVQMIDDWQIPRLREGKKEESIANSEGPTWKAP